MPNLSPIDHRLAALWELRQIELVAKADAIADAVGRLVVRRGKEMLGVATSGQADFATYKRLERIYAGIIPELVAYLRQAMPILVRYSDRDARHLLAKTVPRSWWRVIMPDLVEAAPAGRDPLTRLFGKQNFSLSADPALVGQAKKMSDEEFQRAIEKVVLPPLTERQVDEIVKSPNPHTRDSWEKRLTDLSSKVQSPDRVAGEIISGMATGENVNELRDRVDKHVGKLHGSSMRIARTEARRVAETANRESLKQSLGDLLDGWQISEILDERTRPHHAARHGTIYRKGGQPAFEDAPDLPDEPNCRGTLLPVLKTPKEVAANPAVAEIFKNAAGSRIPDPAVYSQWFRGTDERRKRLAVGSRRFDIVRKIKAQGGQQPEWEDFIGGDGKLLPAVALKTENPIVAAIRKSEVKAMLTRRREDFLAITQAPFVIEPPPLGSLIVPPPLALADVTSLTGQQRTAFRKLAKRIAAGNVPDGAEQLRQARLIAPSLPDVELRKLIDLALADI